MTDKKMVSYTVMGRELEAPHGASLLGELRKHGFEVPSLCYHPEVTAYGACRLCLVEVKKGKRTKLTTSCNYPVQQGVEVSLDTEKVQRNRKMVLELLLAQAPKAPKGLTELAEKYGVSEVRFPPNADEDCILCGLCSRVCSEVVGCDALTFAGRGDRKAMAPPYAEETDACILCGACVEVCPVGCIDMSEKDGVRRIGRWHREQEVPDCEVCGAPTMPVAQASYMARRTGLPVETFKRCVGCRDH